jgi:uncharacterized protein
MRMLASLILGCLLATQAYAADTPSPAGLQAASQLLQVMGAKQASQQGTSAMIDNLLNAQPMMQPYRDVFTEWAAKYLTWDQLEPQMAALYANAFTTSELQELTRFYETPTGRKAARVIPALTKQAMKIGSAIAQQHLPELQEMIKARAAELQKASPSPPNP